MSYPRLVRLRQQFERTQVADLGRAVRTALEPLLLSRSIRPGQRVALTAGSRGIANIASILRQTVRFVADLGAHPFIVPAMGSHGGGTAEGQRHILESYGITEHAVGCPIHASMDVVTIGTTPEGFEVFLDKQSAAADHIGVVARVKPHTGFHGAIESGLLKMLMIGLGKHVGALAYHRLLLEYPYEDVVRSVSRVVRARSPISFGLAIVENAYDETALIDGVAPDQFELREEELLVLARRWLPKLPFPRADLLIVDEIGKDVSGSGMDTNVVGRKRAFRQAQAPADQPVMRLIYVRGLSAHTHGNATGIGLADFTSTQLVRSMNYQATVINCLTAGYPDGAFLPVHFDTDRQVLDAALAIIGTRKPSDARVMRIRNTLQVENVSVSESLLEEYGLRDGLTPLGPAEEMAFDGEGRLC